MLLNFAAILGALPTHTMSLLLRMPARTARISLASIPTDWANLKGASLSLS
jgi:hypothetical protein